jgi:hypothetical protein
MENATMTGGKAAGAEKESGILLDGAGGSWIMVSHSKGMTGIAIVEMVASFISALQYNIS